MRTRRRSVVGRQLKVRCVGAIAYGGLIEVFSRSAKDRDMCYPVYE